MMKKIVLISTLCLKFACGVCCVEISFNTVEFCGSIQSSLQSMIPKIVGDFTEDRETCIIEPTKILNDKMIQYNKLNGKVYAEERAILDLNDSILKATKKQEALLAKLAELKNYSVKYNNILQKSNLGKDGNGKK